MMREMVELRLRVLRTGMNIVPKWPFWTPKCYFDPFRGAENGQKINFGQTKKYIPLELNDYDARNIKI